LTVRSSTRSADDRTVHADAGRPDADAFVTTNADGKFRGQPGS
jgi:hypothetical protein